MEVGIKYCGGCNPRFDRSGWVRKLAAECTGISFEPASKDKFYDILLIISGCPSACASHDELKGREKIFVKSEQDADRVRNFFLSENSYGDRG